MSTSACQGNFRLCPLAILQHKQKKLDPITIKLLSLELMVTPERLERSTN